MDKVNRINHVIGILRNKVDSKKAHDNQKILKKDHPDNKLADDLEFLQSTKLKSILKKRLSKIDKKDDNYQEVAEKIFVESTLSHEFGEKIANNIEFSDMVSDIQKQIHNKPELKTKLYMVINNLVTNN